MQSLPGGLLLSNTEARSHELLWQEMFAILFDNKATVAETLVQETCHAVKLFGGGG